MKIDLHTHTAIGSPCSQQSIQQIVEDAICRGIDGVCITDHNTMRAKDEAARIASATGFLVLVGIEVTADEGDFLLFGAEGENFPLLPYRELRRLLDRTACAIIPAHVFRGGPFRRSVQVAREFACDFCAIEVYSTNMTEADSRDALALAAELGLPAVGCSDSHLPGTAGLNYTDFEKRICSVGDLVAELKSGRFRAVKADYDRPGGIIRP